MKSSTQGPSRLNPTFISQERAQCRMMMVQDGPYMNAPEKPLKIMGDPMRVNRGRDLVTDLMTEKELEVTISSFPVTVEPPVSGHPRDFVEVSAYGRLHITMQTMGRSRLY